MQNEPLVSIVIPVFNGEHLLEQTLVSIERQSYSNIEVLMVDDMSSDNSCNILRIFEKKDRRFKVYTKEHGGMVPKTLNFILPYVKGEYFFYSSQDDIFSETLIENLVSRQLETLADTVLPDMEFYYENKNTNKRIIGLNSDRTAILSGESAFIESLNWNIHGFALFKSSYIKKEWFPEDAFDTDELVTRKLFLKSNKVAFSEGVFYYRQDNNKAITKTFTLKNFYLVNTGYRLYSLMMEYGIDKKYLLDVQEALLTSYFKKLVVCNSYKFNSRTEKNEVITFLRKFRTEKLTKVFLNKNLGYALKNVRLKFLILHVIYTNPMLFKSAEAIYFNYLKGKESF